MIRFISFPDRDFRYVSLAFLKALIVAVSPAFSTGDVDRLMGDRARSTREGAGLTTVTGPHVAMLLLEATVIDKSDRVKEQAQRN